jgi:hypothetical protein
MARVLTIRRCGQTADDHHWISHLISLLKGRYPEMFRTAFRQLAMIIRSGCWQLAGDTAEQAGELLAEQCHGADDDDGDEGNHQAVLNGGGTTVTAVTEQTGNPDLKLDE